ncbi:hypothetical protein ACWCQL_26545 [Streptomyces sp. NPDC002073]
MTHLLPRISARRRLAAAVLAVWLGLTASPAAAEGKVTVTGPDKSAVIALDRDGRQTGRLTGHLRIVVSANEAPEEGAPLTVQAYLDADGDSTDTCSGTGAVEAALGAPVSLERNEAVASTVDVAVDAKCAHRAGTLVFQVPGHAPATVRFTLTRDVEGTPEYEHAMKGVAVAALLAFFCMILPVPVFGRVNRYWLAAKLPIEAPFSTKDSWLTTVASLGALLGIVLGASNVVTEWLPGISTAQFVGLNITFGAFILFAPVIYAASCSWGMVTTPAADGKPAKREFKAAGRGWGLVASACTTLLGVFGQLATLLVMVVAAEGSRMVKGFLVGCLCLAAVFVWLYAVKFVRGALTEGCAEAKAKKEGEGPAAGGTTGEVPPDDAAKEAEPPQDDTDPPGSSSTAAL